MIMKPTGTMCGLVVAAVAGLFGAGCGDGGSKPRVDGGDGSVRDVAAESGSGGESGGSGGGGSGGNGGRDGGVGGGGSGGSGGRDGGSGGGGIGGGMDGGIGGFGGFYTCGGSDGGTDGGDDAGSGGVAGPSCAGMAATCGACGNEDCCASPAVPGGSYNRYNPDKQAFPATVSTFRLDKFEITVGRFRAFVEAGKGTNVSPPAAGAGAHPLIAGTGWNSAWNPELATNTVALKAALKCDAKYQTWTDAPAGNENRPMNCITWYDTFAFCAWDGGRVPTEAEWGYAAGGGSEQRYYPWGGSRSLDPSRGSYRIDTGYCIGDGVYGCELTDVIFVGTRPAGNSKWGHADLFGNMNEWNLDVYRLPPRLQSCTDCADMDSSSLATARVDRGGAFYMVAYSLDSSRGGEGARLRDRGFGGRCARNAP